MLTPGPDHPITIDTAPKRWRAFFAGHVIADTSDALILREANLGPVVYFPRADVAMEYMSRTDRSSHCPYKGDAGYYTILMDGEFAENAVWTYDAPFEAMTAIAGRLAFYTDKVEVYEVDDAAVNPRHRQDEPSRREVDQVVQHTDSGGGLSQGERWDPNVETPANDDGGLR
jgi:uncharacterized protein (DUF427 family)